MDTRINGFHTFSNVSGVNNEIVEIKKNTFKQSLALHLQFLLSNFAIYTCKITSEDFISVSTNVYNIKVPLSQVCLRNRPMI